MGSNNISVEREREENQESNYKTTPGVRDKSFQLPQTDNKNAEHTPYASPIVGGG